MLVTISLFAIPSVFGDHPVLDTISGVRLLQYRAALLIRFGLLALVMANCAG